MPHYILKLADDEYVEWTDVCDAPYGWIKSRADAIAAWGEDRIARTDRNGHSALWFGPETVAELVAGNRAGEREATISVDEIREAYRYPGAEWTRASAR